MGENSRIKSLFGMLRTGSWLPDLRVYRLAICGAILFPIAFAVEFWLHLHLQPKPISPINFPIGEDFANFWSGSALALEGNAKAVFDIQAFQTFEHINLPPFLYFRWFAYPPTTLLVSLPFGLFPYLASYALWLTSGWIACAVTFKRSFSWPMAIAAAVFTPASFVNAVAGQNGAFTAAVLATSVTWLDEYPAIAGLTISLMCFKPHLAVLFPLALAASKHWRALGFAGLGSIGLIAASLVVFGSEAWTGYLHIAPLNKEILEHGGAPGISPTDWATAPMWYRMPTVFAAVRAFELGIGFSYASQAVSAILAMALVWYAWQSDVDFQLKGAIFILGTFAVTPYAWDYDLVAVNFAVVWLWMRGRHAGYLSYEKTLLGCLFASTLIGAAISAALHVPVQIILIWVLLLLSIRHVAERQTRP
jgi:hypothetical protein